MKLRNVFIFTVGVTVALLSGSAFAKSYSTSETKALIVADGKLGQRICYYDDKAYTVGAVIKVDDVLIMCTDENDFETNGSLKWFMLPKSK
ncbi:uncharacterized protein DUF1496 [Vibrio sp. ES.051]|uniref:YnjH family protein n=1 Tax=Vibrio sp. ES.051 TaxID=1761909 RepID=UPI000BF3EA98|nr:YnjH family protein [Vibrio sp. ES.051]PFG57871.1 uncharacterized protein DUF1496 [Vibrio sp. ES.051]